MFSVPNKAEPSKAFVMPGEIITAIPDFITLADVKSILTQCAIPHSEMQLIHIFSASKMILVNDLSGNAAYSRMVYVEFIECLCRLALKVFNISEMDELPMAQKLKHILINVFKLIN